MPAAAQQARIVDEGTLNIEVRGAPARSESFRIVRLDVDLLEATGRLTSGNRVVTSALTTDTLGTPVRYVVSARDAAGRMIDSINIAVRGRRLSALSLSARGNESLRELPIKPGETFLLDDELLHQMYFVALLRREGEVELVGARTGRRSRGVVQAHGLEPLAIGGRSLTGTHYSLTNGSIRRDFWVDAQGRLLRVDVPGQGLSAVREEPPR